MKGIAGGTGGRFGFRRFLEQPNRSISQFSGRRQPGELGADLTGADLSGTTFCRTTMPDGTLNNQGCMNPG